MYQSKTTFFELNLLDDFLEFLIEAIISSAFLLSSNESESEMNLRVGLLEKTWGFERYFSIIEMTYWLIDLFSLFAIDFSEEYNLSSRSLTCKIAINPPSKERYYCFMKSQSLFMKTYWQDQGIRPHIQLPSRMFELK